MTQEEIRAERHQFELWATVRGMLVGRDEAGYYDDDEQGAIAWKAWLECARRHELKFMERQA